MAINVPRLPDDLTPAQLVDGVALVYNAAQDRWVLSNGLRDTGWRNISADVLRENGYDVASNGQVLIRRIGDVVHVQIWNVTRTAGATGNIMLFGLPALGYRPNQSIYGVFPLATYARYYVTTGGGFVCVNPQTLIHGYFTWITDQIWPPSLPGVPF